MSSAYVSYPLFITFIHETIFAGAISMRMPWYVGLVYQTYVCSKRTTTTTTLKSVFYLRRNKCKKSEINP